MAKRVFTANVVTRDENGENRTFMIGDEVPEGVFVGDHAATSAGVTGPAQTSDESPENVTVTSDSGSTTEIVTPEYEQADGEDDLPPYEEWSKTDLRSEVDGRELDVPSKANKDELIAALQADDAEQE